MILCAFILICRIEAAPGHPSSFVDFKSKTHLAKFIIKLNEASVPTRYPENLATLQKDYTQNVVREIIFKTGEVLNWIKSRL